MQVFVLGILTIHAYKSTVVVAPRVAGLTKRRRQWKWILPSLETRNALDEPGASDGMGERQKGSLMNSVQPIPPGMLSYPASALPED